MLTEGRLVGFIVLIASQPYIAIARAQSAPPPPSAEQEAPPSPSAEQRAPAAVRAPPEATAAQDADADAATAVRKRVAEEQITVTGSRIRRKDLTTPAPVTVISREQVVASGKVSIGDFLQSLPEQGNAINTSVNNGGTGATRVSLRGLGTARTLVLLNGRRMVPGGSGADASVDLNSIPTAAIERIEVLKDGASAVYGSDAIAGVVNIITRKNFRQTEVNAFTGTAVGQHARDGATYDFNVTTGIGGDRGNVTFSVGYYNQQAVFAGDRDFSRLPRTFDQTGNTVGFVGEYYGTGSGTIPQGRVVFPVSSKTNLPVFPSGGNSLFTGLTAANPKTSSFVKCTAAEIAAAATGSNCQRFGWRPFNSTTITEYGGDLYNFQPDNYLVTPQQRIMLYSAGDTRLGSFARGFYEASFVNRQSSQKLAAEPLGTDGEGVTVSATNPFNPFGTDLKAVRRRLVEFGTRDRTEDIDTFRVVGGLDGTLPDEFGPLQGWSWEASVNFGRTQGDTVKTGNLLIPNLSSALGGQVGVDNAGTKLCSAGAGSPVVPCLDLFGGEARPIADTQMRALTFAGTQRGINQLAGFNLLASGELFRLAAERPLGLALGYEFRTQKGSQIPDPVTVAGLTTGNKGEITQGSYYVNEAYGELSMPLLSNAPFAQNLEASVAARVFKYSTFGSDWTYKFGGRYTPVRDVTLRGTYSTGFRAPSINDLFLGQQDSFPNVQDPCRLPVRPSTTPPGTAGFAPDTCGAAGGNGDTATQLRTRIGGNPGLKPETSKSWTVGLVFEPRIVQNFSATLDYYNITVDRSITTIGARNILQSCYIGGVSSYCDLVTRDPSTQRITNIVDTNTNVGKDETDGIDIAARYALPTGYGRFGFIADVTWLHKFDRTLADGSVVQGRGNFDIATTGGVYPAWKGNFGTSWALSGFNGGVNAKWIGSFHECGNSSGAFGLGTICTGSGGTPTYRRLVPAYVSFDVYAGYTLRSAAGRTTLAGGINNVGDHRPALIYSGFLASSDPTAYDYMGRFGYVRLTHTF